MGFQKHVPADENFWVPRSGPVEQVKGLIGQSGEKTAAARQGQRTVFVAARLAGQFLPAVQVPAACRVPAIQGGFAAAGGEGNKAQGLEQTDGVAALMAASGPFPKIDA